MTTEGQWMDERMANTTAWSNASAAGVDVGRRHIVPLPETIYSLRIPPNAHRAACPRCGHCWRLSGPTAYADADPICDLCLLTSEQQLGMVLALVSITRMYAGAAWTSPEEHHAALVELGAFARIYDRFASRFGAPRMFDIGDLRLR